MRFVSSLALFIALAVANTCRSGSGACCNEQTLTFFPSGTRCDDGSDPCSARFCTGNTYICPSAIPVDNVICQKDGFPGMCYNGKCVVDEQKNETEKKDIQPIEEKKETIKKEETVSPKPPRNRLTINTGPSVYDNNPVFDKSLDDYDYEGSDDEDDDSDDDEEDEIAVTCSGDCCNLLFPGAKPDGSLCGRGGVCEAGECVNQKCIGSCCQWMSDEALPDGSLCGHNGKCSKGICLNQQCLGECCSLWGWSDDPVDDNTPCTGGRCVTGVCVKDVKAFNVNKPKSGNGLSRHQRLNQREPNVKKEQPQPQQPIQSQQAYLPYPTQQQQQYTYPQYQQYQQYQQPMYQQQQYQQPMYQQQYQRYQQQVYPQQQQYQRQQYQQQMYQQPNYGYNRYY